MTDKFFYDVLRQSEAVTGIVSDRIFNTGRPEEDETEDRVPYIIVTFDGMTNDSPTKDDVEGDSDTTRVSILCVTKTRTQLAELTTAVRNAVMTSYNDGAEYAEQPFSYMLSANGVQYDMDKPCYFQTLQYQCNTER